MKFDVKTDEQLAQEEKERKEAYLIPAKTTCDATVVSAQEKLSDAGNEMIVLDLLVHFKDRTYKIKDYIVATQSYKVKNVAKGFGLLDAYNKGQLTSFLFDSRPCKVIVGIQVDKSGQYPDKNKILEYVEKVDLNDSIPF